jgi:hypothetical protein
MDPLFTEDINRGFAPPLLIETFHEIPMAFLAPLGCHKQETINEMGQKDPKYRMIHDQSIPGPSGLSVNLRVRKEALPSILYSWVLLRSVHCICNLRSRYPTTKIYFCKVDLDAAYHRWHLSNETASESLAIYNNLLLMALRMTFGGSPCPSLWGYTSETLANDPEPLLGSYKFLWPPFSSGRSTSSFTRHHPIPSRFDTSQ